MSKPLTIEQAVRRKWHTPAKKTWWYQKLAAARRRKLLRFSEQQGHRCCYCEQLTWMFDKIELSSLPEYYADRLPGMDKGLMATLEHLVAISAGGTDHNSNLVMCCDRCNNLRSNYVSAMEFWEIMHNPVLYQKFIRQKRQPRQHDHAVKARQRENRRLRNLRIAAGLAMLGVIDPRIGQVIATWSAWLNCVFPPATNPS